MKACRILSPGRGGEGGRVGETRVEGSGRPRGRKGVGVGRRRGGAASRGRSRRGILLKSPPGTSDRD